MDNKFNWSKHFLNSSLLVLFLINIYLQFEVRSLNDKVDHLIGEIYNINSSIDDSIGHVSSDISRALEKEASMINSFDFEYGDIEGGQVDLKLSVSPKEISYEKEYFFSYSLEGEEKLVVANIDSPSEVIANINIPLNASLQASFIEKDGETRKIESLQYIYSMEESILGPFSPESPGYSLSFRDDKTIFSLENARYSLEYMDYGYEENLTRDDMLKGVKLYFELNDSVIESYTMIKEDRPDRMYNPYVYEIDDYSLDLKATDELDIYTIAEHEDGYMIKIIFAKIYLDKSGMTREDTDIYTQEKSIIY